MVEDIASNYIFGLMISCLNSDKDSLEYHDAKAALEDLSCLTHTVYGMVLASGTFVPMDEVAQCCTKYQKEALEQI